jgi:hypothetical protein
MLIEVEEKLQETQAVSL